MHNKNSIGKELLNVPMGTLIRNMGLAMVEAQRGLDEVALDTAEFMSGSQPQRDPETGEIDTALEPVDTRVSFGKDRFSMMELGFIPTFYQFVETLIEVRISIKITETETNTGVTKSLAKTVKRKGTGAVVSPVDATFSNKYSYSAEGSSLIRTKLVPVPPPVLLEERIRAMIAAQPAEPPSVSDAALAP